MRLIILLAVTSCFFTSTSVFASDVSASDCVNDAIYTTGAPLPIAIVGDRVWLGNHESERDAIGAAKAYGLCVENYGIKVDKMEPLTKKAVVWHKISGYSVWKND